MILRLFRGALAVVTVAISIPYTVAIVSNILHGWPQNKHKYKRALDPKKVLGLNYVIYQMLKDKSKFLCLYLKWRKYYSSADARRVHKNIPYGRNDCCLDVHMLKGKTSTENTTPVIIFVYGGSWSSGDKSMYGLLAHQLMIRTNSVVVCPSYSTYPKGYVDDMVQDIADCITWAVENIEQYGGDPNKIVLMGHSAGAQLCALTILELLRDERISVDSSFKFKPAMEEGGLDELAFAESHYGKLSSTSLYAKREILGDSSGSSESFAVVSDNGSVSDNNGNGNGSSSGGNNNGLESSTASSAGFLSAAGMNADSLDSSITSEAYVKAGVSEGQEKDEKEATEETGPVNVEQDLGSGDGVHRIKSEDKEPANSDEVRLPEVPSSVPSGSGSVGDDEEEVDEDSGDNDSIITVKHKDMDRHLTLSDLCKSVKAFIGLGGVYSIGDHFQHEHMRGIEDVSCMARAFYGQDHFDRFSPLEIVQRVGRCLSLPQIVLVHGTEDYIVPLSSSSKFADALSKLSPNVKLRIIPDCPHYEVCLDLMDKERKFYSQVMNIVLETLNSIS